MRQDPKGRNLRVGETYNARTGRYRYSYMDNKGRRRQLVSWTLTVHDIPPAGKNQKRGESLREKEARVQAELINEVDGSGGNMTVMDLVERYIALKSSGVRETTRKGYRTQINFLNSNVTALRMAKRKIKTVTALEAEEWMMELHKKEGRSYSSLHTLKGVLRQAFILAKKSRWVVDNPFDFSMAKKAYGGTKTRDALSREDMRRFLDFVQTDTHFCRYYDAIFILFNTGLRISEFCGLTPEDIDFSEHVIHVRRQLLRVWDGEVNKYYIEEPKTQNGLRDVPMMPSVEEAFRHVIERRPKVQEIEVWDELHQNSATGFLWIDKDGHYEVAQHWSNHLRWARAKFNRIYKNELPPITPHVCRHTFCSNCVGAGISPKTLQIVMGHSSIEFTLNVYTHLDAGDVKSNFFKFTDSASYVFCDYKKVSDDALDSTDTEEEGMVDFTEDTDDDN